MVKLKTFSSSFKYFFPQSPKSLLEVLRTDRQRKQQLTFNNFSNENINKSLLFIVLPHRIRFIEYKLKILFHEIFKI